MKRYTTLLFFLIMIAAMGQASRWDDLFSYSAVKEINQVGNKLFCTSSNALFTYDLEYNELQKVSKANKLNAVSPSSVAYNALYDYLLVGYESGELDLLGEESYNFIEIPLDEYQGSKAIHHLSTYEQYMFISADYGMSIFDLERREFAETTFFRTNNEYITANETDYLEGRVYTASANGVFSHELNEIIPNFNNWELAEGLPVANFEHIQTFNNRLIASTGGEVYVLENGTWQYLQSYGAIRDINVNDNHLILSTNDSVIIYDELMNLIYSNYITSGIMSAIYANGEIYVGTEGLGMISVNTMEAIYPSGPFSNSSFGVTATQGNIWIAPGGILSYIHPIYNGDGFSHYDGTQWIHVPKEEMRGARDIVQIAVNPNDINQVYASAWHWDWGIFEVMNDEVVQEWNNTNGPFDSFLVIGGSVFDQEGNLYVTTAWTGDTQFQALHKLTPSGQWSTVTFENFNQGDEGTKAPVIGEDGWIWVVSTRGSGVVATNMDEIYQITSGESSGDLPSNRVYAICIDHNGTAWIGTQSGLRVKSNPVRELQAGNPDTQPIVIVQDGIPEALLTDTAVTDIEVDGSNRKWIATEGAGVFYVTEYGREVVYNFTESNSALPSDVVYDIAIDNSTGYVYFATEKGAVSYKGDAKDSGDSFGEIVAYPNPVRPGYDGEITIKGIADNADVRITDVVGNLIYKSRAAGGIIQWDQTNLKGQKVASGVYLVLMANSDGMEKATTKIAIIR